MYTDMENWAEIRRRVLVDGQSKRSVCREFDIHWETLQKILDHPEPPGYRRTSAQAQAQARPLPPVIHQILEDDRKAPKKQRHTARRIFERLRDEHGYNGGLTVVKDAVAAWRQRSRRGLRPAGPPARRGPGRLRRGRGHPRRPADQGGPVRHDPAVLRRHLRLRLPARVHRGVPRGPRPGLRLLRRRAAADQLRQPARSPSPRSPAAATARSPTSSSGSRAITCSRPTSAWCGGPTRRGTSRPWSATPAATSSCRSPSCTAAWSRSTPTSSAAAARTWTRRLWGKPATKAELLDEERAALPAAAGRGVRGRAGRAAARSTRCRWSASTPTTTRCRPSYAHHRGHGRRRRSTTVRIVAGDRVVAVHRRCWGREQVTYDPVHYLALLERKPGALDFAGAAGGLGAAGLLRRPAAAAGGRVRRAGDAAVHQGPAAAGAGRPAAS